MICADTKGTAGIDGVDNMLRHCNGLDGDSETDYQDIGGDTMMHIGLVDVDKTDFPNISLMKISAYHKSLGDIVEMVSIQDVEMGNLFTTFDKFYVACVFSWNIPKIKNIKDLPNVSIGGIAVSKDIRLPEKIEHIYPDYALYGIKDTAYGFLSRGCPRRCPFCVVAGKEGTQSVKVADLSEWWNGQKEIVLCDPNILACPDSDDLLAQLIYSKAYVDINQGLDIRLINKANIEMLNQMKIKMLHFAWDNPNQDLRKHFEFYREHGAIKNFRKLRVYTLVNYWSTFEQDLERIYWLRDNGYDPYVMIYEKYNAPKRIRHLARWVNNKFVFRKCEKFEDYNPKLA